MLDFSIGEKVSFQPDGQAVMHGIVAKYNRKSVTVITDNGQQWRVAPHFLQKTVATSDWVSPTTITG